MNEIKLDNIGEWIGKKVEVSELGETWFTYTLVGFDKEENRYVVAVPHVYAGWSLCRPPQPKRRVPTDQDAAQWPRLKCWVRDFEAHGWNERTLIAVIGNEFTTGGNGTGVTNWRYCEIEDNP